MGVSKFETSPNMNTVELMIQLIRAIWITGKVIIMVRRFCVIKGLLEVINRGFYGSALIKKMRYYHNRVNVYCIN